MCKLTDIPYSKLKEKKRAYEIMLLRDLYNNTFTVLAQEYGVSVATVISDYDRIKIKQILYYINHLAIVHNHESTTEFFNLFNKVDDCYRDYKYVTAYFEKEYREALTAYRAGEPGLPEAFLATLPPFKEKWSKYVVNRVVKLREEDNATFITIGVKLKMTAQSAQWIYQNYYHEKFMALSNRIMAETKITDLRRTYYDLTPNSKKQYRLLCEDYPEYCNK